MLKTLATLLLFQCLGEFVSFILNISVPGPVIWMLLLLLALRLSNSLKESIEQPSIAFLKCLSLLFVPAGVGVMVYASSVQKDLVALWITIVVSTALTLSVTAVTVKILSRAQRNSERRARLPTVVPAAPSGHEDRWYWRMLSCWVLAISRSPGLISTERHSFGFCVSVMAYIASQAIHEHLNKHPLANPVLISVAVLIIALHAVGRTRLPAVRARLSLSPCAIANARCRRKGLTRFYAKTRRQKTVLMR